MFIVDLLVSTTMLANPVGDAPADIPPTAPLAAEAEPSEARYPPGHCYGQYYSEDYDYEDIKGQCVAWCYGFETGVVVNKRYVSVDGDHDGWCERKAERFCDALALSLDYWCWGEEND